MCILSDVRPPVALMFPAAALTHTNVCSNTEQHTHTTHTCTHTQSSSALASCSRRNTVKRQTKVFGWIRYISAASTHPRWKERVIRPSLSHVGNPHPHPPALPPPPHDPPPAYSPHTVPVWTSSLLNVTNKMSCLPRLLVSCGEEWLFNTTNLKTTNQLFISLQIKNQCKFLLHTLRLQIWIFKTIGGVGT